MIDKKKIEETAEKASAAYSGYSYEDLDYQEGFKDGIDWFKENLWHEANEEPKGDGEILVLCGNKVHYANTLTAHNRKVTKWRVYVEDWFITRWLYIEDLMKGGK